MVVMEALLLATGLTGGLTLVWLLRLVAGMFARPAVVAAQFGDGTVDRALRELAAARREVLLLTDCLDCPAVAQALVEARARKAQVDVILGPSAETDPGSSLPALLDGGLMPLIADHRPRVSGNVLLIDGRTLLVSSGPFHPDEERQTAGPHLIVCKDQPELIGPFREQLLGCRAGARQPRGTTAAVAAPAAPVVKMPAAPPEESFPSYTTPDDPPPALPTPASSMLSRPLAPPAPPVKEEAEVVAVAPTPKLPALSDEDDAAEMDGLPDQPPAGAPPVTLAAAELFARLRREVAAAPAEGEAGA